MRTPLQTNVIGPQELDSEAGEGVRCVVVKIGIGRHTPMTGVYVHFCQVGYQTIPEHSILV
jgi:hypothetical protein